MKISFSKLLLNWKSPVSGRNFPVGVLQKGLIAVCTCFLITFQSLKRQSRKVSFRLSGLVISSQSMKARNCFPFLKEDFLTRNEMIFKNFCLIMICRVLMMCIGITYV